MAILINKNLESRDSGIVFGGKRNTKILNLEVLLLVLLKLIHWVIAMHPDLATQKIAPCKMIGWTFHEGGPKKLFCIQT